ncbi:hypothetical protein [Candidatus Magnetaquicoccus inordinatus]|uniref:hypothetical protein n=1 Tax=Candidatus Magnetaquicoccus inordinatus TaxID=2496818 RepID=UPI00102B4E99|nr:hypothetical protein [Candidatus Magnetaquicoccus inordinatus]
MKIITADSALWTAEIVRIAKKVEQIAWQNWLAANTAANKAIYLAARTARLRAMSDWRYAKAAAQHH